MPIASLLMILAGVAADPRIAVIEQSAADWNRGDLAAFVASYEHSPDTTFVSSRVAKGTDGILERYQKTYPDREHMGTLTFSDFAVRELTPELAIVTGRYHLDRLPGAGGPASGIFTLVMRKGASGWRVIHDHTSKL